MKKLPLPQFILALLGLFALCGVPGAHGEPLMKYGCATQACVREHDAAVAAARAVVSARALGAPVVVAPTIPQPQRAILAYRLQDMLTQATHKSAYITNAELFQYVEGGGFLVCGAAVYDRTEGGIFVMDLRDGGDMNLHATQADFGRAGCAGQGLVLR